MDNLTHSLVGLTVAKAGLDRLSPSATAVCILAANAPDIDILSLLFGGRWSLLHHHRGITHSIAGTLTLAVLISTLFWLANRIVGRISTDAPRLRYRGLLVASLIAAATHPLLDWTNNYGIRLLLPWSGKWFYGDLIFIVDPWIWLTVGGAAFLLSGNEKWKMAIWLLLTLALTFAALTVPSQRGGMAHPNAFRIVWLAAILGLVLARRAQVGRAWGRYLALASLALVATYSGLLAVLHHQAYKRAVALADELAQVNREGVLRVASMPTLADPLEWQCVAETDRADYRFTVALGQKADQTQSSNRFPKPQGQASRIVGLASEDPRAEIFLGFARFPIERVEDADCFSETLVQFADLRFTEPGVRRGTFSLEVPVACPPK
jgi:inner membrane protein